MKHKKATIKQIKSNFYLYSYSYVPVRNRGKRKERRFEWKYRGPYHSRRASLFKKQLNPSELRKLEADYRRRKDILEQAKVRKDVIRTRPEWKQERALILKHTPFEKQKSKLANLENRILNEALKEVKESDESSQKR